MYARQNAVGRAVLVGVAEVLGLPPDTFARSFDEGDLGTIRLISYPGYDEPVHTFTTANANSGDHSRAGRAAIGPGFCNPFETTPPAGRDN